VFDVNNPGRGCDEYNTVLKDSSEYSLHGEWDNSCINSLIASFLGIVSSMAFNYQFGQNAVMAAATYMGRIGIYSAESMDPIYILEGQLNGITHVR